MQKILNIGLKNFEGSKYELKIRRLFNGLTFFGFFTAVYQTIVFYQQDSLASLFHASWGIYCFIALFLHAKGFFYFAKVSLVFVVMLFGTLASAKIGSEYYAHIPSFGILVGIFVFFDIREEWRWLLFFILLHAGSMIFIESNIYKNSDISFDNPQILKTSLIIGTALFVALEVITILRLSWLNEKEINESLKRSNEELKQSNEEKTVMLQEIHHRVKNNFQVVISLIKLQTQSIEDPKTISIFRELRMRLISIARMHEMMYLSEKLNKIDFKSYVQELSEMILSNSETKSNVQLDVNTNVDHLSAEGVVPLALILNELITNSIKHAFQNTSDNKIEISFTRENGDNYSLEYIDNGIWKEPGASNGFGLELITLLAEQLDGTVDRSITDKGTLFSLHLKI